jgi:putative lipoprotein
MTKKNALWGTGLVVVLLATYLWLRERPLPIPQAREEPLALDTLPLPVPRAEPERSGALEARGEAVPASATAEIVESPAGASPDGSRRFMFECGKGIFFAIRVVPGEATVFSPPFLGPDVLTLAETESTSGARYASGGDVFWNKGDVATFEVRGQTFVDCTSNPSFVVMAEARARGVIFRALGNEPSWLLEIYAERIVLTTELGRRRIEFPFREATVAGRATTYRVFIGTQELLAVVDDTRGNDTMSGEAFDKTVAVTFEGATMYGCGGTPAAAARLGLP